MNTNHRNGRMGRICSQNVEDKITKDFVKCVLKIGHNVSSRVFRVERADGCQILTFRESFTSSTLIGPPLLQKCSHEAS